jgi:DNA-directed RNA polymerase specialized sigma24 family protein
MEETLLVQLARQGNEEAVDELFGRVWPVVWHWAYAVTADRSLADNVAQETVYRAFAALDRFDAGRPFLPWLKSQAESPATTPLRPRCFKWRCCLSGTVRGVRSATG